MKKRAVPLRQAVWLLVLGLLLGSVFTFGVPCWNAAVTKEECTQLQTRLVSYTELRRLRRPADIKEIAIDCADGNRYFIDGACVTEQLCAALSALAPQQEISLLLHPHSNTVMSLCCEDGVILPFDEVAAKLGGEAKGFGVLGLFLYGCALVGLWHVALHITERKRA